MRRGPNPVVALAALLAVAFSLWQLAAGDAGIVVRDIAVDGIPARIYRLENAPPAPAIVIAHGFAGSSRLMEDFSTTLARAGYVAVAFDFAGHGRNALPLGGDLEDPEGATRILAGETARMVAAARGLGDGRVALLGHSMASDVIARVAIADPTIAATIAVSMFSPVVTADAPSNLLVIVGEWESWLAREAMRVLALSVGDEEARPGTTFGDAALGTARRVVLAPHTEHVSVLYSRVAMEEAVGWVDLVFGRVRPGGAKAATMPRGPLILLLLGGLVALARPLASLLPRVAEEPRGAGLGWRRLWPALLVPALATPLLLRVLPTHFLPILIADYLAVHFAVYGLLTGAILAAMGATRGMFAASRPDALAFACLAAIIYSVFALGGAVDRFVTDLAPSLPRAPIAAALVLGTTLFFLALEWMTRGSGTARGGRLAAQAAFLLSLALATALDPPRLFFLILIVPVMIPLLAVFALLSRWTYGRTGHPFVGAVATAAAIGLAIAATFPMISG